MRLILLLFISSYLFAQKEGDNLTLFNNGDTSVYFYIHEGKKEGYEQQFFENGLWKSVGNYHKGQKIGWWKWFYENGTIRTEGDFVEDKKEGYWRCYNDSGHVINEGWYEGGLKSGFWYEFTPEEEDLNPDHYQPLEDFIKIDSTKLIKRDEYYLEKVRQNYWCTRHSGLYAKGHYYNGQKEGWWEYYNGNRLIKAGFYNEGNQTGEWGQLIEGKWYLIDYGN